jgi:hypothetical protein
MIKVLRHGNRIAVVNPVTGQEEEMVNVVFVEEGRDGADAKMSESSDFLSSVLGEQVGLTNLRIHTHPILAGKVNLFPIGKELPGHINRGMYSTPQLRQQIGVDARIVDGRPTYFKTWISNKPEDDKDERISNDVLASVNPGSFAGAQIGATVVRLVEEGQNRGAGEGFFAERRQAAERTGS